MSLEADLRAKEAELHAARWHSSRIAKKTIGWLFCQPKALFEQVSREARPLTDEEAEALRLLDECQPRRPHSDKEQSHD